MTQVPMTPAGEQALREELKRLRNEDRPRLARAIGEAREHGDLRENAEYHAAKEQQGLVEARIRDIEGRLAHARVIDLDRIPHDGRIVFGVTVELLSLDGGKQVRYQIVGEDEARVRDDAISFVSPMARSLIGRYEGDEITLDTPGGVRRYEILSVSYE
ncbi:MAG: transcription elongation factor GreA [Gammaproteobacteria bacterium]|nr:transcription elongation factor GreA [Gammaproteobacteria bacterium]